MAIRLLTVTYGHDNGLRGGVKAYDYETDKQYRAGDTVVVPVTHYKSKRVYNTLATVMKTTGADTEAGQRMKGYLEGNREKNGRFKRRVEIKDVGLRLEVAQKEGLDVTDARQVNITTLPGYSARASDTNWQGRTDDLSKRVPNSVTRHTNGGRLISR
jgi:hypothetical protein